MAEEERFEVSSAGGPRAPRWLFVVLRLAATLIILGGVVILAVLIGRLPGDTERGTLALRAAVGLGIGAAATFVVWRSLRAMTRPPPPPLPKVDARSVDVVYLCVTCGTRLRLEVASTGKAPRHCGEEMEAQVVPEP